MSTSINRSILIAVVAHISTVLSAIILILIPSINTVLNTTSQPQFSQGVSSKLTLFEAYGTDAFFIVIFPWVITLVTTISCMMGRSTKDDKKQILWRWRSYSWASTAIMIIFLGLLWSSIGAPSIVYVIPTILVAAAAVINK